MRYSKKSMNKSLFKSLLFSLLFIFTVVFSPLSFAEGMFGYSEVQFFEVPSEETATDTPLQTKKEPALKENIWTEPAVGPDGRVYYYTPPRQVLNFISDPTEENAKAYLNWNKVRYSKYNKAQKVLDKVAGKEQKTPKQKTVVATRGKNKPPVQATKYSTKHKVLYFIKSGCKYCTAEDLVIDKWNQYHKGEFDIQGIFAGEGNPPRLSFPIKRDSGESLYYKITKYATIIFLMPSGRSFGIKGFASGKALEKIYQENRE